MLGLRRGLGLGFGINISVNVRVLLDGGLTAGLFIIIFIGTRDTTGL